jgi:hypothetical protein
LVPTCADRNLESEVDPHHRHILRRSAGGVYPVSGADFGNSNSNADYFLLGDLLLSDSLLSDFLPSNFLPGNFLSRDFLPSDFLPSDTFVSVHLTARRNYARHKTRCGRDRLRNHTGRVDPIFPCTHWREPLSWPIGRRRELL